MGRGWAMRAFVPAVVLLAPTLGGMGPPPTDNDPLTQGCGMLAPFGRDCEDPRREPFDPAVGTKYAVNGYAGKIKIILRQQAPFGITLEREQSCTTISTNHNTANPITGPWCTGWTFRPPNHPNFKDLIPGWPTQVLCQSRAFFYPGTNVAVQDAGLWGCTVEMNYQG
jgi:hypothetical protein